MNTQDPDPIRIPIRLVPVKLSPVGRVQTCRVAPDSGGSDGFAGVAAPLPGSQVVIETDHGPAVGTVVAHPAAIVERRRSADETAPRVIRVAARKDIAARFEQQEWEKDAGRIAVLKIKERGLEMKLARVESTLDRSRLTVYFTAESRVDFRELVRDLAVELHARIDMRQIGVRDEAKLLGGYGTCGRPLCCTTFLNSFEPISIKMAKQQELSLNPSKLSGLCGRLKCCLRYELPNAKGQTHGGCGGEGGCDNPTGCGTGGCRSGGCGSCR